jgi:hypothetical protein
LSSVIRNQGHNVIIIHHCGGKQHKFKIADEHEDIEAYINTLEIGNPLDAEKIKQGYEHFKHRHNKEALNALARQHNLAQKTLSEFVGRVIERRIFDGEKLTDLFAPLGLGWKESISSCSSAILAFDLNRLIS